LVQQHVQHLNREVKEDPLPDETVQRAAGTIAWHCLSRGGEKAALPLTELVGELADEEEPQRVTDYLSRQLHLFQTTPDGSHFRLKRRPVGEYLASAFLIAKCGTDREAWNRIFRGSPVPGEGCLAGLGQALLDCSVSLSDPLAPPPMPAWVSDEIETRLGREPARRESWRRQLGLHHLLREILAPENPERSKAIDGLAQMGADAAPAIPTLLRAFRNRQTDIEVRHAVFTVLGLLGSAARSAAPACLATIQDRTEHLFLRVKACDLLAALGVEDEATAKALTERSRDPEENELIRLKVGQLLAKFAFPADPQ
jgi:hypothetical protein